MIRVDILKELKEPYFKTVDIDSYVEGVNNAESWTEDLWFCKNVLENTPYRILVDTGIMCDHFDIYSDRVFRLPRNSLPFRQKLTNGKKCLMLGKPIDLTDGYDVTYVSKDGDINADYRCSFDVLPFDSKQFDFVVVTEHQQDFINKDIDEWKRVCKGKLAINCHPWLNIDMVAKYLGGSTNGTFVEMEVS